MYGETINLILQTSLILTIKDTLLSSHHRKPIRSFCVRVLVYATTLREKIWDGPTARNVS